MITVRAPPYLIRVARHILSIQALCSLNGTPGEIWTHTILILSQTPHASWATGAYRWVCAITLALLGCPPAPYSHSVWDATKVSPLLLSKILDFYQAPRSLPDYYCLTPPIVLAAVFHQLRFTLAEVNQLKLDWKDSNLRSTVNSRKS